MRSEGRVVGYPLDALRRRHPRFAYRACHATVRDNCISFDADFEIEPDLKFRSQITIPYRDNEWLLALGDDVIDNLAFHLGLMEIPSYWKATCSPRITVEAGPLDEVQLTWWQELLIDGLGEFFFTNGVDFTAADFVTIESPLGARNNRRYDGSLKPDRIMIGVGGGKDSAVTAEILAHEGYQLSCLMLNPTPAALDVVRTSGITEKIVLSRKIDQRLLDLNQQGYLNGHTPFSAYLAFAGEASGILNDYGRLAVSNERSSNEGNAYFLGREINHQYSKTFSFEQKFRQYASAYLSSSFEYFSFLRPLYELQIAKIFAGLPAYFSAFRSCNRGQKTNTWCQACPKCLFVYACLFPFVERETLSTIFTEDLFAKPDLVETALELTGVRPVKPLECVGCREECVAAFYLCKEKILTGRQPLPVVVEAVDAAVDLRREVHRESTRALLRSWNEENAVPPDLVQSLMSALMP